MFKKEVEWREEKRREEKRREEKRREEKRREEKRREEKRREEKRREEVFVAWVHHVFIVTYEWHCAVCSFTVCTFVLKLFVVCNSSCVMLQSNEVVFILSIFVLLFFMLYFLFRVFCGLHVSPYLYCCSCPLQYTISNQGEYRYFIDLFNNALST